MPDTVIYLSATTTEEDKLFLVNINTFDGIEKIKGLRDGTTS
jgi:hypothetical protein